MIFSGHHDSGTSHITTVRTIVIRILTIFDEKSVQQVMFYKIKICFMVFMFWVITYYYPTTCNMMM